MRLHVDLGQLEDEATPHKWQCPSHLFSTRSVQEESDGNHSRDAIVAGARTDASYDLKFPAATKASQPASPWKGSPRKGTLNPKTPNASHESSSRVSTRISQPAAAPPAPALPPLPKEPEAQKPPPIPHELQVSRPPSPPWLPRNKLLAIAGATATLLLASMFAIKYRNQTRKKQVCPMTPNLVRHV